MYLPYKRGETYYQKQIQNIIYSKLGTQQAQNKLSAFLNKEPENNQVQQECTEEQAELKFCSCRMSQQLDKQSPAALATIKLTDVIPPLAV